MRHHCQVGLIQSFKPPRAACYNAIMYEFRPHGHPWGVHRVLDPQPVLPQAALRLDPSLPPYDDELLVKLKALHLDSASMAQIRTLSGNPANTIMEIVAQRGKMHNPVTNSGGVFLGELAAIGPNHPRRDELAMDQPIISLVSLTLTPLSLTEIHHLDVQTGYLKVSGWAILFASGLFAQTPSDLPESVALAALDICGAPSYVDRYGVSTQPLLIVGLGKAGVACAARAEQLGIPVIGVDAFEEPVGWCQQNLSGHFARLDAHNPLAVAEWVQQKIGDQGVALSINTTNQENTEMASVLPCQTGGRVIFFGMNTHFQKVVLGAEGVGKDLTLQMGNGFVEGHAVHMLELVRTHRALKQRLIERYG